MQSHLHHTVILGGGYAGMMAAARLARDSRAQVTLVDARSHFAQRIRFHELLAGSSPKTLAYQPLLGRRDIRFMQGFVERLEPERQRVVGRMSDGARFELGYDQLIIALGSTTGAALPGIAEHTLRLDDPVRLAAAQAHVRDLAGSGGRVLVVGGGLTGIEAATELAERYPTLRVTLATQGSFGADFSALGRAYLRRRLADLGVELREQATIGAVEPSAAWLSNGAALPFDLCVWAAGFAAPALARDAGLAIDGAGRALVEPTLQTCSYANIFAIGDVAAARRGDQLIRMGCVSAMPMGVHAGENSRRLLHGAPLEPFSMDFVVRCISLGRRAALVQRVASDDTPRERIWTRRPAVLTKELIGRLTLATVYHELRWGVPLYPARKPRAHDRPQLQAGEAR